jgi:RNA polymerase sigma-70 factor (ECF subfamily)
MMRATARIDTATIAPDEPSVPDFRETYDAHFPHVWHTLRRLGVPEGDLEDAAHDVFVVVHRRLTDFDPARPLRPWLSGIAWRVASDRRRSARARHERVGVETEPPDGGPDPERLVQARQARVLVQAALESLDLDRRVVFVMHELDGASVPEIAEALDVPLNTVYSRLRIARERFAGAVKRLGVRDGAGRGGER